MIFQIPLPNPPIYNLTFQVELDGTTYSLTLYWNPRDESWYITIADSSNSPILSCQRCVVAYPIGLNQAYNTSLPPGSLQFQDTSGQGLDPGQTDMGARVILLYFDAAEILSQLSGGPTNVPG